MFNKDMRLVIASHNQGKVREIRALLAPFSLDVMSAADMGIPEPASLSKEEQKHLGAHCREVIVDMLKEMV